MKVAIHQPNFLPWIGFFQKIAQADNFVFFDDVQYPRGKSYCSRTKILVHGKEFWLSVSTLERSKKNHIKNIKVSENESWKRKHLKTIELNYKKSKYFNTVFSLLEKVYHSNVDLLIDYNIPLIIGISKILNLRTNFFRSSIILPESKESGSKKIIEICKYFNADTYITGDGHGSKRYICKEDFEVSGIKLKWQHYTNKEYKQLGINTFVPKLSIIDLIFNEQMTLNPLDNKFLF